MGGLSTASVMQSTNQGMSTPASSRSLTRDIWESSLAIVLRSLAAAKAIELMLRRSADMQTALGHPSGCLIRLCAPGWSTQNAELRDLLAKKRARNRQAISAVIERAVDEDQALKAERAELATLLKVLLLGMSVQARDGVSRADIQLAIDKAICIFDSRCSSGCRS